MTSPRGDRRRLARVSAFLAIGGCAQVLGLPGDDEIETVARAFCKCDDLGDAWPGESCEAHVEGRLASVDPEVRQAWLDLFTKERCEVCDNVTGRAVCAGSLPLCVNTAGACGTTQVCCLADGDNVYCGAQGVCVVDPPGCLEAQAACGGETPCCGQAGQLADCFAFGEEQRCVEGCNPLDDGNCTGCCARTALVIDGDLTEADSLCLPPDNDCGNFCNLAGAGKCLGGYVCVPLQVEDNMTMQKAVIDACLEPCSPQDFESPGTSCVTSFPGAEVGCCARIVGPDGDTDFVCIPSDGMGCDTVYCDATADVPSCNGCATQPLLGGEAFEMTIDLCP